MSFSQYNKSKFFATVYSVDVRRLQKCYNTKVMSNPKFSPGEYYHIFNRGTDKRDVFMDKYDVFRFLESMELFNRVDPIGSIQIEKRGSEKSRRRTSTNRLVSVTTYCLNSNHYHFVVIELIEGGISEFMKRLGGGYTKYFNEKYERSGALFQGKFKSVHIESNEQLLYVADYVNLNNKVHKKFNRTKKHFMDSILARSSWDEYTNENTNLNFCKKDIILDQYKNKQDYKKSALETLSAIKEMRYAD